MNPMNPTNLLRSLGEPAAAATNDDRPAVPPATGDSTLRARVRQAAIAAVLGYLAFGVALPWLLTDAPALNFAIAAAPVPPGAPAAAHP
jgi:hypothetical protein